MRLGAGLLIALAVGAAAAGWWLLGGVVLAGSLAAVSALLPSPAPNALLDGSRVAARLAMVSLFASAFAAYLVPRHSAVAAVAVVLVVTAVDAVDFALPRYFRRWLLGILLVAAAGLVAVCLAVPPVPSPAEVPGTGGVFVAAAVLFPLLPRRANRCRGSEVLAPAGLRPHVSAAVWKLRPHATAGVWGLRPHTTLFGAVVVALAVCAAALYQLGGVRLGLSAAPVRDLLAAVDGQAIEPLLAGVVVFATVPAALGALAEARAGFSRVGSVAGGLLAAAGAALLGPKPALLVAAALALAEVLVASLLTLAARRWDARAVASAVLAVTMLAWLPPRCLLLAFGAIAVAAAVTGSARRRARSVPPRSRPE
ncbi:MAG TPA: hypothetical protein VJT49_05445 [Amycolatopsis sp.]|uniref:hypothetical protein n=1 Tax=Amycolatopsis sp. TaxID=37632 RepID=UPI002B468150|nr:hypothetical protein [Amycolatopsis sp.]HKS44551.1 hypothetical protein [Amycolatopsis sp.]